MLNILSQFDIANLDRFGLAHLEAEATKLAYDAKIRSSRIRPMPMHWKKCFPWRPQNALLG